MESARWLKSMVGDKQPMDYKRIDESWRDFGNFNAGAVAVAAGFSLGQMQRMAGYYQTNHESGDKATSEGSAPWLIFGMLGMGGTAPYGDSRQDSGWIADGASYYECRMAHPR